MKYNKVFVAGANGMLGTAFQGLIKNKENYLFTDKEIGPNITFCDITDSGTLTRLIHDYKPDLIINFAALIDLEYCEKNESECYEVNTGSALHLFKLSIKYNIPYIFISTAGIFGNEKEYWTEQDEPNPLSYYGQSKCNTEAILNASAYKKWWIFRAGWMMGGGPAKDKKFVNKIIKQIDAGANELFVVDDKTGAPTYTKDFASSILRHLDEDLPYGLYNMVGQGEVSRYEVAEEIVNYLMLDINVNKVNSDHFKDEYFAPRPNSEKLINEKLNNLGRNYMRDWKECLHEYLDEKYQFI